MGVGQSPHTNKLSKDLTQTNKHNIAKLKYPLEEIAHLWELLNYVSTADDGRPEVILKDNEHDISVSERVAREELASIEAQPALQLTELLGQSLFKQLFLHSSLLSLGGEQNLGDGLEEPVHGEHDLVGLRLLDGVGAGQVADVGEEGGDGHGLADHFPLVLQDWHGAIGQDRLHLGKIFTSQSDIVKLDSSML